MGSVYPSSKALKHKAINGFHEFTTNQAIPRTISRQALWTAPGRAVVEVDDDIISICSQRILRCKWSCHGLVNIIGCKLFTTNTAAFSSSDVSGGGRKRTRKNRGSFWNDSRKTKAILSGSVGWWGGRVRGRGGRIHRVCAGRGVRRGSRE